MSRLSFLQIRRIVVGILVCIVFNKNFSAAIYGNGGDKPFAPPPPPPPEGEIPGPGV
jgi:hypothetical protein